MMLLYEATAVQNIYEAQAWKYDRVEIPLEPRPADMSSWSGTQFKARVKELVTEAFNTAKENPELSIEPFKEALSGDSLSEELTPTVLLFVADRGGSLLRNIGEDEAAKSLTEEALKYAKVPSTAYFALQCDLIGNGDVITESEFAETLSESENSAKEPETPEMQMTKLYEQYSKSESARYVLLKLSGLWHIPSDASETEKHEFLNNLKLIEHSLEEFPNWYNNGALRNKLAQLTQASMRLHTMNMCAAGGKVKIYVTQNFTGDAEIEVRKLPVNIQNLSEKQIKSAPVVDKIKLTPTGKENFDVKDTLEMDVATMGYYFLIPKIGGKADSDTGCRFRAVSWLPIALNFGQEPMLAVMNAESGAPEKGVVVNCYDRKNQAYPNAGITGETGLAHLKLPTGTRSNHITLKRKDVTLDFPSINISGAQKAEGVRYPMCKIFTSRSVYHPGDTVEWAALVYESADAEYNEYKLGKGREVKATFYDANHKEVASGTYTTDSYGRVHGQFATRTEGLTGNYRLEIGDGNGSRNWGGRSVTVSDFKLPTFEAEITSIERDIPEKGGVRISGKAISYSGMPIGDAQVKVGIMGETSPWWRGSSTMTLGSIEGMTDDAGIFSVDIPAEMLTKSKESYFRIKAEATVTARGGETESASRYFSTGKPYSIMVDMPGESADAAMPIKIRIEGMTANPEEKAPAFAVIWSLQRAGMGQPVLEGEGMTGSIIEIDASKLPARTYFLTVRPKDSSLASATREEALRIYNTATGAVPEGSVMFVPNSETECDAQGRGSVLVGVEKDGTWVYTAVCVGKEIRKTSVQKLGRGFHEITFEGSREAKTGCKVLVYTVKGCRLYKYSVDQKMRQPKAQLKGESLRDKTIPGAPERWRLRFEKPDGQPGTAAGIATLYNRALNTLRPLDIPSLFPVPFMEASAWLNEVWRNTSYGSATARIERGETIDASPYNFKYAVGGLRFDMVYGFATKRMMTASQNAGMVTDLLMCADENIAEEETAPEAAEAGGAENGSAPENIDYRVAEVLQGFWMPELTAESDGTMELSFTMPNAIGGWTMEAYAWDSDLASARLTHELASAKPVMVQPTVPRFMRQGDKVVITATLYNNTDDSLEIRGGFDVRDANGKAVAYLRSEPKTVGAGGSETISIELEAPTSSATLSYKIWAEGAGFTDGEQGILPVLESQSTVIESECFYLNAGRREPYILEKENLPGFVYTLQYCQNPVWSLVRALRGNAHEPNTAPEIVSVLFSNLAALKIISDNPDISSVIAEWKENPDDGALRSMLEKNEQLKALVLDDTPWVSMAENASARMAALADFLDKHKAEKQARKLFEKLYGLESEGGICWADWSDEPAYRPTENVLTTLGIAQSLGLTRGFENDVRELVKDGLKWLDKSDYIKNLKGSADLSYTYLHSLFPEYGPMPSTTAGKRVCENTLSMLEKKKTNLGTVDKGYAILTLRGFGRKAVADEMARSLEQFGVMSADMGMSFPSVQDIRGYATLIQALSESGISREKLDAMRQWVILQTQGTDDLGAWNPDYVIAAVMLTGSVWTSAKVENAVTLNGTSLEISKQESASGYFSLQLPAIESAMLQISVQPNGETPSYGSLTRIGKRAADEIEPKEGKDLRIVKRLLVKRNGEWTDATVSGIEVGETVRTDLEIRAGRDLEYVTITDERPAGMEPLNQLPGAICGALCYYQESRDASTRIFAGYVPKGTYHISYEQRAWSAGEVICGICTVQSQLAPELTAHSGGTRLKIRKNEPAGK